MRMPEYWTYNDIFKRIIIVKAVILVTAFAFIIMGWPTAGWYALAFYLLTIVPGWIFVLKVPATYKFYFRRSDERSNEEG